MDMVKTSTKKFRSPRSLYNAIGKQYHDNREKASNDVAELPVVMKLLGDMHGKKILDMGCGIGKHSKEFIKRGAIVTGYDISEKMVNFAKIYCGKKGSFFRAAHETVDFPKNSFDACNASYTINYSNKIDLVFSKVNNWLRPGGIFTFSITHPLWLNKHVENMDFSKPKKLWFHINSYDVDIFNYYYPLDYYIGLSNKYNFHLVNIIEAAVPKNRKGWPDEKYRLPIASVFKLIKE